jgi:hypothetical protein
MVPGLFRASRCRTNGQLSSQTLPAWAAERFAGPLRPQAGARSGALRRSQPDERAAGSLRSLTVATSAGLPRSRAGTPLALSLRSPSDAALALSLRWPFDAPVGLSLRRREPSSAPARDLGRVSGSSGAVRRRPACGKHGAVRRRPMSGAHGAVRRRPGCGAFGAARRRLGSAGRAADLLRSCRCGPRRRDRYAVPARRGRMPACPGRSSWTGSSRPASALSSGSSLGPWVFRVPQPRQPTSRICIMLTVSRQAKRAARPHRERPSSSVSGGVLLSHAVPRAVPSALKSLTSGFGMGPGVSPSL